MAAVASKLAKSLAKTSKELVGNVNAESSKRVLKDLQHKVDSLIPQIDKHWNTLVGFHTAAEVHIQQINGAIEATRLRITDPNLTQEALNQLNALQQGNDLKQALEFSAVLKQARENAEEMRKKNVEDLQYFEAERNARKEDPTAVNKAAQEAHDRIRQRLFDLNNTVPAHDVQPDPSTVTYTQTYKNLKNLEASIKQRLFEIEAVQVAVHFNAMTSFVTCAPNLINPMKAATEAFEKKLSAELHKRAKNAAELAVVNSSKAEFDVLKESELKAANETLATLTKYLQTATAAQTLSGQSNTQAPAALVSVKDLPARSKYLQLQDARWALPKKLIAIETRMNATLASLEREEKLRRDLNNQLAGVVAQQVAIQAHAAQAQANAQQAADNAQALAQQLAEAKAAAEKAQAEAGALNVALNNAHVELRANEKELADAEARAEAAEDALARRDGSDVDDNEGGWVITQDKPLVLDARTASHLFTSDGPSEPLTFSVSGATVANPASVAARGAGAAVPVAHGEDLTKMSASPVQMR